MSQKDVVKPRTCAKCVRSFEMTAAQIKTHWARCTGHPEHDDGLSAVLAPSGTRLAQRLVIGAPAFEEASQ